MKKTLGRKSTTWLSCMDVGNEKKQGSRVAWSHQHFGRHVWQFAPAKLVHDAPDVAWILPRLRTPNTSTSHPASYQQWVSIKVHHTSEWSRQTWERDRDRAVEHIQENAHNLSLNVSKIFQMCSLILYIWKIHRSLQKYMTPFHHFSCFLRSRW